ncbi:MAG: peptidylprolyl isomerase [Planctomycetota bacterium]|jgi:parvulin-like peptidyl-prolyl isomerase
MAARLITLCLLLATALPAQETKTLVPPPVPAEPAEMTAADRIEVLRSQLATLEREIEYLKKLKAEGGMLSQVKKDLTARALTYRVFGEGLKAADVNKPRKATLMDEKEVQETSQDVVLLVNGSPIRTAEIDELVYYAKSYPRPEKHAQIMTFVLRSILSEATFASNIPEARMRIDQIEASLAGGAEFEEIAATMSQAKSSGRSGDMGFIARKGSDPTLTMHAFSMKVGEVSPVIQTERGFEIIKVTELEEGSEPAEDKVRVSTIVASFVGGEEGMEELEDALRLVDQGRLEIFMRDRSYLRFLPKIYQ